MIDHCLANYIDHDRLGIGGVCSFRAGVGVCGVQSLRKVRMAVLTNYTRARYADRPSPQRGQGP